MTHRTSIRVRFYELDPFNHVNHSVYLQYLETARVEALESVGAGIPAMVELGYQMVVVTLEARYRVPAVAGDSLIIETIVSDVGRAACRFDQRVLRDDTVLLDASLRAGVTNTDGRPARMPPDLAERLAQLAPDE